MKRGAVFVGAAIGFTLLGVGSVRADSAETLTLKKKNDHFSSSFAPVLPKVREVSSETKNSSKRSRKHHSSHHHHHHHHHAHHHYLHLPHVRQERSDYPSNLTGASGTPSRAMALKSPRSVAATTRDAKLALVPMTGYPHSSMGIAMIKQPAAILPANEATSGAKARFLHPFVTASAGFAYSGLGTSVYFPVDTIEYIYQPSQNTKRVALLGGSIGDEIRFPHGIDLQLGVGFYAPDSTRVSGNLTQGLSPDYSHYRYHYTASSQQVMAEAKLLFTVKQYVMPYLYFGLGEAFNKAYQFSTTVPLIVESTPNFPGKTSNNTTWSAGVGVDVNLVNNLRLGLGYRYAYLGELKTGKAQFYAPLLGTTYMARFKQSSWVMNTFLLQLTYVY